MSSQTGLGAVIRRYALELGTNAGNYQPGQALRLATAISDLAAVTFDQALGDAAAGSVPHQAYHAALYQQVRMYIQDHLSDPLLSPTIVADAHHISLRLLYRLFAAEDIAVAGWIRNLRLEGMRRDLADPDLKDMPIRSIAAQWGLVGAAARISNTFKCAYGMSPQAYRTQALQATLLERPASTPGQHASAG
jgi:AraC-like DNA-binding protein